MQAPKNSNLRTFFDQLATKKESMAECGVVISDDDYIATILQSLPPHYASHASQVLATAKVTYQVIHSQNATLAAALVAPNPPPAYHISPAALVKAILDEFDRREDE